MHDKISVIRDYLSDVMRVNSVGELEALTEQYKKILGEIDAPLKSLCEDFDTLGREIIYLKTGSDDERGSGLLASLSETESAELEETEKIIAENLFDYHFQPIVSAVDGDIYSYEVLMRPQGRIVRSPLQVLKYAELRNKLNEIERATFLNILGILDADPGVSHEKKLFINSIPKTHVSAEDRKKIDELMSAHSAKLVVELTEKAELDDVEYSEFKNHYESMNIGTAIDDYGTGYSNVQNLLRYMPDYVKIDRSLLSDIQDDSKKRHFVREIVDFCHDNGILALAEGVETSEELRCVILLGVDLIQGFYTGKPTPKPVKSVQYKIRQEIKSYAHERQEGMESKVYVMDIGEHVNLGNMVKDKMESILIDKSGDFSISGEASIDARMVIDIADNTEVNLNLDNVRLTNSWKTPCIEIGRGCIVNLIIKGDNRLNLGGIRVPEESEFDLSGDGNLGIVLDYDEYFGIGNDMKSGHGDMKFNQSGLLKVESNGKTGICIGSGLGGKIELNKGKYILEMNSDRAVGMGSFGGEVTVRIKGSDINIDLSSIKGIAIGSEEGNADIEISETSTKVYMSGNDAVCFGSLSGKKASVFFHDASTTMNIHNDRCSGVAALDGKTEFRIERAAMRIYAKGENVLPFGGFSADSDCYFTDTDVTVKVMTAVKLEKYLDPGRMNVTHGSIRIVLNGFEYELLK